MRSIKFPKMFGTNHTEVWQDSEYAEATAQNTHLTLGTSRGEIFGDPYFGLLFKQYLFDQNSYVLRDTLIDMIYTQLALFVPQITVRRQDIQLIRDGQMGKLICQFVGKNQIDYELNTYSLVLVEQGD